MVGDYTVEGLFHPQGRKKKSEEKGYCYQSLQRADLRTEHFRVKSVAAPNKMG